jgi:competence CoiA-like predicted nuclease
MTQGAINKETNKYTHPSKANKQDKFICIDCGEDLYIRQGDIRIHHFRNGSK